MSGKEVKYTGQNEKGNDFSKHQDGGYTYTNNKVDKNTGAAYQTTYHSPEGKMPEGHYEDKHNNVSWSRNKDGEKSYR